MQGAQACSNFVLCQKPLVWPSGCCAGEGIGRPRPSFGGLANRHEAPAIYHPGRPGGRTQRKRPECKPVSVRAGQAGGGGVGSRRPDPASRDEGRRTRPAPENAQRKAPVRLRTPGEVPVLSPSQVSGEIDERSFEERLQAIKASQARKREKSAQEKNGLVKIDYNAPVRTKDDERPARPWVKAVSVLGGLILVGSFAFSDLVVQNLGFLKKETQSIVVQSPSAEVQTPSAAEQGPPGATEQSPGAEVQTPGAAVQNPSAEVQTPGAKVQAPGAEGKSPSAEVQTPGAEVKTPSAEVQSPSAEKKSPSAEVKSPSAEVQTPGAEVKTPSAEVQSPSAEKKSPSAEVKTPGAEVQSPSAEVKTPSAEVKTPSADVKTPSAEVKTPSADVKTPSAEVKTPSTDVKTPSAEVKTPSAKVQSPSAEVQKPGAAVQTPSAAVQKPGAAVQAPSAPVQRLPTQEEERLQKQVETFEAKLRQKPGDAAALEGAGVSYAELGDYKKATEYFDKLVKARPYDGEALRLLAEAKSAAQDFAGAAYDYRRAIKATPRANITLLKGLADALINDKKAGEAVRELLDARERIRTGVGVNTGASEADEIIDPVQVELLLAKAYQSWDKNADALTVYNALITARPDDFRPYLAKGLLLKQQKQEGEAERNIVKAYFLAPPAGKQLIDRLTGR